MLYSVVTATSILIPIELREFSNVICYLAGMLLAYVYNSLTISVVTVVGFWRITGRTEVKSLTIVEAPP